MTEAEARILVVDDDPDYRWLLQTHLRVRGYRVLLASDGADALEVIAAQAPTLVILDIQMPRMDGYAVCQRVREFSTVPIILLSGLSAPSAIARALDVGADCHMTKPVSIDELASRVGALLRRVALSSGEAVPTPTHPQTWSLSASPSEEGHPHG